MELFLKVVAGVVVGSIILYIIRMVWRASLNRFSNFAEDVILKQLIKKFEDGTIKAEEFVTKAFELNVFNFDRLVKISGLKRGDVVRLAKPFVDKKKRST